MAFAVAQLNAIEAPIGTGELTVSFEGRTVTYRSMSELKAARAEIRAEVGELANAKLDLEIVKRRRRISRRSRGEIRLD